MKTALNISSENKQSVSILKEFKEMTKMGLALSVVFSTLAGYVLAVPDIRSINYMTIIALAVGGYCMVGASNVYNQIIERDLDAKMNRTANRPIASGRVKPTPAFILAVVLTLLGIGILYAINPKTAMFGAISIFLYTSVYTPLKTITPLSVFVGAFPGAIPFMLGWVAETNNFGIEAGTLFLIQFFWQFPHFWAIGWFLFDDYKRGGFSMLPTGKKDNKTLTQIILYTIWLIIVSIFPVFNVTGRLYLTPIAAGLVLLAGIWMLTAAVKLYKQRTDKAARALMLVSVTYISLIQIIYVLDKILR
ncbi:MULTISPECIES: heme o synthase [Myroides]|jgi:protoheme IX farnesyltransferase|uniref:Protoheme IX farnesyltransferase n=1 Tax=Myroides odoratus TaxID=256 RepID=A0A378RTM8_MYROD|nr:heme o synthase [Myroides odoratus]MDH6601733.1 protoheme IX farnesyltransferase [Myroides gitamensis]EHQ43105.1 Protoheme IX farnesyltransferase [Myroides odoratus DSM 2801]EKB06486.1 protoheme IX farnesyltransferase [Myroides odoratus CIP 103059]MCS4237527.1 protoheme IX farnesyltransferase [Myroides odoratus]MDR0224009.1 heme o synthase [Myroides odoratus]